MDSLDAPSDIAEFYRNRTILITGGTGFMGKVLLEKLLRSCTGIKRIYLLIRWKHGNEPRERLHQLFESKLFGRLKKEQPTFLERIVCVNGNLELENLAIENKEFQKLVEEVSVIFHLGADIKFDENLKKIVNRNVCGTKRIIDLAKKMKELKAFVYVSTAYSNTHVKDIYEKVYCTEFSTKSVIDGLSWMSDEMVEAIRPILLARHPNNYCYTKCLTEQLFAEEAGGLPVVIVRPTIVTAVLKDPIVGWNDSLNGFALAYIALAKGIGRVMYSASNMMDVIPVDICINLMVASAWDISLKNDCDELVVYHCSTNSVKFPNGDQRQEYFYRLPKVYPSVKAYRYPNITISTNVLSYEVHNFVDNFLPSAVIDLYLYVTGRKPGIISRYKKFRTLEKTLRYFYSQQWNFHTHNTDHLLEAVSEVDKQTFDFNVRHIDWEKYMNDFALNAREYFMKEDPSTLHLARSRLKKLYYIEMGIKISAAMVLVCLLPNDIWDMFASWYHSISSALLQLPTPISSLIY